MQISKSQVKALKIHREMQKESKKVFIELKDKLEKAYFDIFKNEKLDENTARILKKILETQGVSAGSAEYDTARQVLNDFVVMLGLSENKNSDSNTIIISSEGDLYRVPKEKYCYPMKKEAKRLTILRVLSHEYKETSLICEEAGIKNNIDVRKYIGMINKKVGQYLNLKISLIESKSGSGYRINPIYKVKKAKN